MWRVLLIMQAMTSCSALTCLQITDHFYPSQWQPDTVLRVGGHLTVLQGGCWFKLSKPMEQCNIAASVYIKLAPLE